MARGRYHAELTVRLPITVYAEDKREAALAAHRVASNLIAKTGDGTGAVIGLAVRRTGSAKDEWLPRRSVRLPPARTEKHEREDRADYPYRPNLREG